MPEHLEQPEANISNAVWYLGIDFGTTGISAVLLNSLSGQRYPLYWLNNIGIVRDELAALNSQLATHNSDEKCFRLPAATYSGPAVSELFVQLPEASVVVGSLASTLAKNQPGIFLENFKPYLKIGIPYYCPNQHRWEPTLQLPNQQMVSLYLVRRALQALLGTLTPKSALPDSVIKVEAVGLKSEVLVEALGQLEGVVLGYPADWGDTYHVNLREAVLEAKLVRLPEQIFFVEDAIAPILAALPISISEAQKKGREGEGERGRGGDLSVGLRPTATTSPDSSISWQGGTLAINIGATTTEIAVVDLPDNLQNLTYSDFTVYSLPYAGNTIDQDIFCQLLYPQLSEQQHQQLLLCTCDLELPLPGQPDKTRRDRLVSLLQSTPLGQALLKATGYLKLILQHKEEFTLQLGTDQWVVKQQDLEVRVIQPFIQQLNRVLKALMIETGISEQGIYQVLCIGGTAVFGTLQKWLQQSLPRAILINTSSSTENWVAAGLASLPLYPQVLNRTQQQYSDYFLLLELLRAFPQTAEDSAARPYSLEEIMQQLERRGLNTGACYERLVRLVEGQLPPGLVPSIEEDSLLSQASKQNLHALALASTPQLFSKQGNQLYRLNRQQQECLSQYLDIILSGTYQKFEEPLIVKLGTSDSLD
jgi:hypothetical protein